MILFFFFLCFDVFVFFFLYSDELKYGQQSGNPTQMLEQSVRDLKINSTQTPKFKSEASQVISAMLEARLKPVDGNKVNILRNKSIPLPITSTVNNVAMDLPPPLPESSPPMYDTPFPPPPPPLTETDLEVEEQNNLQNIIPTNLITEPEKTFNNFNKKHIRKSIIHVENSINPKALTKPMHATNRLSYVESNNQTNNDDKKENFDVNHNQSNEIKSKDEETSRIANGLKNGEHPICCQCNIKITR